jgi:hypothetical protein
MRGLAHRLLTARSHDVGIAIGNLLHAQSHRAQAGAAQLVHAPGRAFHWNAGIDRCLPGRVLAPPCRQDLPEDHFVDVLAFKTGTLHRRLEGNGAKLRGRNLAQGAVERTDGCAGSGNDNNGIFRTRHL